MDANLIERYQGGGDIYAQMESLYGASAANSIAAAASTGDETKINAAIVQAKYGTPLNASTWSIFGNQLATDPLAAPLEGANNLLGDTFLSFLKNPWVVAAVVVIVFGAMGGFGWLGRKVFSK